MLWIGMDGFTQHTTRSKLFTADGAWWCLDSKWLFFWGDSNHVDTIWNFLAFVLGVSECVAQFWDRVMAEVRACGHTVPRVFYCVANQFFVAASRSRA